MSASYILEIRKNNSYLKEFIEIGTEMNNDHTVLCKGYERSMATMQ